MIEARACHAVGLAALANGSFLTGYAQLSQHLNADGAPLHYHISDLGIADLAAASVRAERHLETRTLAEQALAKVDPAPGPRLEQLTARAPRLWTRTGVAHPPIRARSIAPAELRLGAVARDADRTIS